MVNWMGKEKEKKNTEAIFIGITLPFRTLSPEAFNSISIQGKFRSWRKKKKKDKIKVRVWFLNTHRNTKTCFYSCTVHSIYHCAATRELLDSTHPCDGFIERVPWITTKTQVLIKGTVVLDYRYDRTSWSKQLERTLKSIFLFIL